MIDDAELMRRAAEVIKANVRADLTHIVLTLSAGRRSVGITGPGAAGLISLRSDARDVLRPVLDDDGHPKLCTVVELTPWFAAFIKAAGGAPARFGETIAWAYACENPDLLSASPVARRATLEFIIRQNIVRAAIRPSDRNPQRAVPDRRLTAPELPPGGNPSAPPSDSTA